eukprot:m.28049 g.28049  ORF g.28049 m.28049 type:complete len:53 (+) comp4882_c0_seq1:2347-2505(+)
MPISLPSEREACGLYLRLTTLRAPATPAAVNVICVRVLNAFFFSSSSFSVTA